MHQNTTIVESCAPSSFPFSSLLLCWNMIYAHFIEQSLILWHCSKKVLGMSDERFSVNEGILSHNAQLVWNNLNLNREKFILLFNNLFLLFLQMPNRSKIGGVYFCILNDDKDWPHSAFFRVGKLPEGKSIVQTSGTYWYLLVNIG